MKKKCKETNQSNVRSKSYLNDGTKVNEHIATRTKTMCKGNLPVTSSEPREKKQAAKHEV